MSASTIGRALRALDMVRKMPAAKPLLTQRHKERRLAWCQANQQRDWGKVVFTDEATLCPTPPEAAGEEGKAAQNRGNYEASADLHDLGRHLVTRSDTARSHHREN